MASGDNIRASEYNAIRAKIIALLGTGTITRGYGQVINSSPVASTTDTVTRQQWEDLKYDLINLKLHQDGLTPSIVSVNVGDVIGYGAGHPNTNYNTLADSADLNRFNIGTGQYTLSTAATRSTTSSWSTSATCNLTVTFSTAEEARFFFNSGGQIRVTGNREGGSTSLQNGAWTNVLASMSPVILKASSGPEVNFYNLTSSPVQLYSFTMSSPYSSNNIAVTVSCDISDNSSGGARILYFTITLTDNYVDPDTGAGHGLSFGPGDTVDGTLTFIVEELKAAGSLLPSGTFTVASPSTYSLSSITVS